MDIIEILKTVLYALVGGIAIYAAGSAKAKAKLAEVTAKAVIFIKEAEENYKSLTGGEKFEQVVDELFKLVPKPLQFIITRNTIKEIVQNTFDQIKAYATIQLDKAVDNVKTNTKKKLNTK